MDERRVVVGAISGIYGLKGWVKVHSFTSPPENILAYRPWVLTRTGRNGPLGDHGGDESASTFDVREGRIHGRGLVARFDGVEDRDAAAEWVGAEIRVDRQHFANAEEGEYYWADLVGLKVVTIDGRELGVVDSLLETGANDVLVVVGDRRSLVPFLIGPVVKKVDQASRHITVDWDPDY